VVLPNFVVIGAGKAGTSALYVWLRQHPDVFMPATLKETFFFCYNPADPQHVAASRERFPIRTLEEYEALFASAGPAAAIGEATPLYLDSPQAPPHMATVIPDARLIASLRDPVSRVWSHAQMNVRQGRAVDVAAEALRLGETDEHDYAPKFRLWLERFRREQLYVFRYDDLERDGNGVLAAIQRFLGVAELPVDVTHRHNPGGIPRSRGLQRVIELRALRRLRPMAPTAAFNLVARLRRMNLAVAPPPDESIRRRLAARYRADVVETQEVLGLDLSDWLG
jgi:hypothetical protein